VSHDATASKLLDRRARRIRERGPLQALLTRDHNNHPTTRRSLAKPMPNDELGCEQRGMVTR
jgi:hypothetical protein